MTAFHPLDRFGSARLFSLFISVTVRHCTDDASLALTIFFGSSNMTIDTDKYVFRQQELELLFTRW